MAKKKRATVKKVAESVESPALAGQLVPMMPNRVELVHSPSDEHERRSDIMDVVLAKAEERMTQAMDVAAKLSRTRNTQVEELRGEIQKALQVQADGYARDALDELRNSEFAMMLQLPSTLTCEASGTEPVRSEKTRRWSKTAVGLRFVMGGRGLAEISVITRTVSVVSNKEVTDKLARVETLVEEAQVAYNEAMEWKKKLAQIPRLSRTVRATLAEQRVRTSEEGSAALDALLDSLDDNIAKLPGIG